MTKIACCIAATALLIAAAPASAADGILVPPQYVSAARVFHLAELGDMNAETQLGWMYANGRGVPQDFAKAAQWYYRAAVQGQGWAQYELGMAYNKGQGVRRDYVLSYVWLNLAASAASGDDRDFKARMRDAVATKLTVAQVTIAQQMALAWYKGR